MFVVSSCRCLCAVVKNEDVVGAAPAGDAPTTSEWSTSLLPTKMRLILQIWQYLFHFIIEQWQQICNFVYIFSCDQAALQMVFSVRPSVCLSVRLSVCPSVRHTFLTMFPSSYHHEIFRSYYQWQKWRPCKRSRSEVKGQGHRGHNPTLPFPDCNSSLNSHMMMKWCI